MNLRSCCALLLLLPLAAACGDEASPATPQLQPPPDASSDVGSPEAAGGSAGTSVDATVDKTDPDGPAPDIQDAGGGPSGFIGSPCQTASDCKYSDAVCLTTGVPGGMCTLACDSSCPDEDGHPVTSCADASKVPEASSMPDGLCVSRCDFEYYPETGCRDGYGCVKIARPNDPSVIKFTCLPNRQTELGKCYLDLAKRGVAFEPTVIADDHPDTHPNLTCHVDDALYLKSPVHGVALNDDSGALTSRVLGSCRMANALVSTVEDVKPLGVKAVRHMGTYNCRVIAGTDTLSQHAGGDAIDFAGFEFGAGKVFTVVDDWEHDNASPKTEGGKFLYEAVHRWYDQYIWNIILTPEYNALHDNHFHVDMTDGSHFLGFTSGHYLGSVADVD